MSAIAVVGFFAFLLLLSGALAGVLLSSTGGGERKLGRMFYRKAAKQEGSDAVAGQILRQPTLMYEFKEAELIDVLRRVMPEIGTDAKMELKLYENKVVITWRRRSGE